MIQFSLGFQTLGSLVAQTAELIGTICQFLGKKLNPKGLDLLFQEFTNNISILSGQQVISSMDLGFRFFSPLGLGQFPDECVVHPFLKSLCQVVENGVIACNLLELVHQSKL